MAKFHFNTVSGINGINLNKVLEFLTGERSVKYEWLENEKTFEFLVKKKFEVDGKVMLKQFESFFT